MARTAHCVRRYMHDDVGIKHIYTLGKEKPRCYKKPYSEELFFTEM